MITKEKKKFDICFISQGVFISMLQRYFYFLVDGHFSNQTRATKCLTRRRVAPTYQTVSYLSGGVSQHRVKETVAITQRRDLDESLFVNLRRMEFVVRVLCLKRKRRCCRKKCVADVQLHPCGLYECGSIIVLFHGALRFFT